MKDKIELADELIQLTNSYSMEKDILKRLELKIELIHVKEELKQLVGEEEYKKIIAALGHFVL